MGKPLLPDQLSSFVSIMFVAQYDGVQCKGNERRYNDRNTLSLTSETTSSSCHFITNFSLEDEHF